MYSTCTPTPFPRVVIGNLSYKNGRNAYASQAVGTPTLVDHNTFVNSADVSGFSLGTSMTAYPTVSNPAIACQPSTQCSEASGQRPSWWSSVAPPDEVPDVTLENTVIHKAGTTGTVGIGMFGPFHDGDDLINDWNLLSNWMSFYDSAPSPPVAPGPHDITQASSPFVSDTGDDYRLNPLVAGSDGIVLGAGTVGIVSGISAMPPAYDLLLQQGGTYYYPMADFSGSVDPGGDGRANMIDFDVTGERVRFKFGSAPSMPANPCGFAGGGLAHEKCGTLKLTLFRDTGEILYNSFPVWVEGSGDTYSVKEDAFVMGFLGIQDPGTLRVALEIGGAESGPALWPMTLPYRIGSYDVSGDNRGLGSLWTFSGTAQGGTIEVMVDGVTLEVETTPGETAEQIAQAGADAINNDPALASIGVAATATGTSMWTNGSPASIVLNDPGLSVTSTAIPALSPEGVLLALLLLAVARARKRNPAVSTS